MVGRSNPSEKWWKIDGKRRIWVGFENGSRERPNRSLVSLPLFFPPFSFSDWSVTPFSSPYLPSSLLSLPELLLSTYGWAGFAQPVSFLLLLLLIGQLNSLFFQLGSAHHFNSLFSFHSSRPFQNSFNLGHPNGTPDYIKKLKMSKLQKLLSFSL